MEDASYRGDSDGGRAVGGWRRAAARAVDMFPDIVNGECVSRNLSKSRSRIVSGDRAHV
jgi:hypothetical protein